MSAFELCVALGPLAIYLLLVGWINLGRRPLVLAGSRETAALGVALVGFVLVGPMQLFLPEAAAHRFGGLVWALLLSFYGLSLTLWLLVARPRLVIYNVTAAQLRPVLEDLARALDNDSRWAGDSLVLPQLGVELYVDSFPAMRNVSLVATADAQSFSGWRRLECALRGSVAGIEVSPNPRGPGLVLCGLLMLAMLFYRALENPQAVAQGLRDWLRM